MRIADYMTDTDVKLSMANNADAGAGSACGSRRLPRATDASKRPN